MKKRRWFTKDQTLVQDTYCKFPMVANPMHEHKPGKSHITTVISGSIRIFDESGWEVSLRSGETIDLSDNLRHAIETTSDDTVFYNIVPLDRLSSEDVAGYIEASDPTYEGRV